MQNLSSLKFDEHLHWPQGRRQPALLTFRNDETKNDAPLEFEIAAQLADRFLVYRNEIAPEVTGKRPDAVFVTLTGRPRTQAAIKVAIEKTVLRPLGVKLTPHQFRHFVAKISLDANPGAYELVRESLGHKNMKTTTNFYAGIDTRRAGRAHAELIMKLRENQVGPGAPSPDTAPAAKGLAPCVDCRPDCICPMANGPQPIGACGRPPWTAADDPFCDAPGARLAKPHSHISVRLAAFPRFLGDQ